MTTKVYLVRHAEAEGNLYRRIHGQYNSILTQNCYHQLEALKERLRDIPLDHVYSSELFRTQETARAICEVAKLPLETRKELREVSMGVWEDKTWGEITLTDARSMELFCASSADWSVEGGETFQQLKDRIFHAIMDIVAQHPGQSLAIVSHGTAIRFACGAILGYSVEEISKLGHSDNTAVTMLEIEEGKVTIVYSDDNTHLTPELSTLARQSWWKERKGNPPAENLWYQSMDFSQLLYRGLYLSCRQEAWICLVVHFSFHIVSAV